jgi:hypothetical protein
MKNKKQARLRVWNNFQRALYVLAMSREIGALLVYGGIIITMKIQVVTLFPEMFEGVFGTSMLWKAQDQGIVEYSCVNMRDFGIGPRKTVDDTPYGGGDGMVLMIEPLMKAVEGREAQ